ncbi:major capsid protein [Dipodfec virus UOA04_Rod_763]|nr:major capsid protein [Dipodfec virus UOA04_Rod_763]
MSIRPTGFYNQMTNANQSSYFSTAQLSEPEHSRMSCTPYHLTTFNAGDIVPIYCREILPDTDLSMDLDFVIRQTTLLTPTMGSMDVDFYAFFVPNRVVNQSWKQIQGENLSGSWITPQVSLAPLVDPVFGINSVTVPPQSVADYYGFGTQAPIPSVVLSACNDLKFRGYVMIYNEFFRDQNYQPPIPMSTLNVYQGFFDHDGTRQYLRLNGSDSSDPSLIVSNKTSDGSYPEGSVAGALYGNGPTSHPSFTIPPSSLNDHFNALGKPLKANKKHDYFTSVLPTSQKGPAVFTPVSGTIDSILPVVTRREAGSGNGIALRFASVTGEFPSDNTGLILGSDGLVGSDGVSHPAAQFDLTPTNLIVAENSSVSGLEISLSDIRMAAAIQQYYEILASGGSRYRELIASFFGIDVDDPLKDIPVCLGKLTRQLDLYQTAQTSPSESGNTPQGNLAAFGYTNSSGHLFHSHFVEHGYLHILAVVRHRNIYSSYLSRDNFRMNALDFYTPPFANISDQPVYTREINPFYASPTQVFGYQEAWAEYRYEPDMVSGYMRPGISGSLALWNYADDYSSSLAIADGDWLKSNSEEILNRSLAITSSQAPQFKAQFAFKCDKTLPMPTRSIPGMDII